LGKVVRQRSQGVHKGLVQNNI